MGPYLYLHLIFVGCSDLGACLPRVSYFPGSLYFAVEQTQSAFYFGVLEFSVVKISVQIGAMVQQVGLKRS